MAVKAAAELRAPADRLPADGLPAVTRARQQAASAVDTVTAAPWHRPDAGRAPAALA